MATTITMHAPSPTPAHLAAALSSLPTRPRSQLQNIELPPIRQAVPEIDLAPAPVPVEARPSSPYAQKRRLLTPEPERGGSSAGGSSGMQTPYRTSPRSTMTSAPGPPPGPPLTVFASGGQDMPYPGRGYPEPAAPRLFDPRADYPPQAYGRDRYDAQPYPPPSQYAVYDGGGGGGKRGREFGVSVNGNGYPPQQQQAQNAYVAETGYGVDGGMGMGMGGDGKSGGRKRRGNLPKETTDKLRAWFVGHLHHPYPTEDEKQDLMVRTGLQMNQISNWFINARRRQLPSMISNARAETAATANGAGAANGANGAARDESDGSSYGGEYGTEGTSPGRGGRL